MLHYVLSLLEGKKKDSSNMYQFFSGQISPSWLAEKLYLYISAVNKDLPTREFKENVEVNGRGKRSVTTALLVAVFIKS